MKQTKKAFSNLKVTRKTEITQQARDALNLIWKLNFRKEQMQRQADAALAILARQQQLKIEPVQIMLKGAAADLIALMKKNKNILFDKKDVVKFEVGSLIHNIADKVNIPKDAVERLKEQKFLDAIKIVEHADRDAIEKWPDAKLFLIGASRKTKEVFGYELKK